MTHRRTNFHIIEQLPDICTYNTIKQVDKATLYVLYYV